MAAIGFASIMATLPQPPKLPGEPTDKIQHILAFVVLSALAIWTWPTASRVRLFAWLSLYGAAIEVVQAIPFLHRDADWRDWAADTAAIVAVLCVVMASGWLHRQWRVNRQV